MMALHPSQFRPPVARRPRLPWTVESASGCEKAGTVHLEHKQVGGVRNM